MSRFFYRVVCLCWYGQSISEHPIWCSRPSVTCAKCAQIVFVFPVSPGELAAVLSMEVYRESLHACQPIESRQRVRPYLMQHIAERELQLHGYSITFVLYKYVRFWLNSEPLLNETPITFRGYTGKTCSTRNPCYFKISRNCSLSISSFFNSRIIIFRTQRVSASIRISVDPDQKCSFEFRTT